RAAVLSLCRLRGKITLMRRLSFLSARPMPKGPWRAALLLLAGAGLFATPIAAQVMPNPLQQILGGAGGRAGGGVFGQSTDDTNSTVLMQPAPRPSRPLPRSAVEQILSARAGVQLDQFGYREMGVARPVLLPQ